MRYAEMQHIRASEDQLPVYQSIRGSDLDLDILIADIPLGPEPFDKFKALSSIEGLVAEGLSTDMLIHAAEVRNQMQNPNWGIREQRTAK